MKITPTRDPHHKLQNVKNRLLDQRGRHRQRPLVTMLNIRLRIVRYQPHRQVNPRRLSQRHRLPRVRILRRPASQRHRLNHRSRLTRLLPIKPNQRQKQWTHQRQPLKPGHQPGPVMRVKMARYQPPIRNLRPLLGREWSPIKTSRQPQVTQPVFKKSNQRLRHKLPILRGWSLIRSREMAQLKRKRPYRHPPQLRRLVVIRISNPR